MPYDDLPPGAQVVSEPSFSDLPPGAKVVSAPSDFDTAFGEKKLPFVPPAPQKPLTATESFYRKIRPYLAPATEMIGGVAGGVAGAGAGVVTSPSLVSNPVTTGALGAGLGYASARSLNRGMDTYLGGYEPSTMPLSDQLKQTGLDVATGATMELGGQVASRAIGKTLGAANDIWNAPKLRAANILRDAANTGKSVNQEELQWAMRTLGKVANPTTAQATASVNNPTWQALMARGAGRDPAYLAEVTKAQEGQSLANFGRLTPGETQTGARTAMDELKSALNQSTTPMREQALERANMGQLVANLEARSAELGTEAAAQVAKVRKMVKLGNYAEARAQIDLINQGMPTAASKYTYKGELGKMADKWADDAAAASLDLGQGKRFADAAAGSLREAGIAPLETAPLVQRLGTITNNPNYAGNDLINGAVNSLAKDITEWTNASGVIDAKALHALRQNSVNATIAKLRPGIDAKTQNNLAAKVMSEVKPLIDDAIEASGGTGWRDYLNTYTAGMRDIAEKKLTGKALDLWKTDRDAFVRLVQGENPKVVEKILGPGNYDIAKELADHQMSILNDEAGKHVANTSVKEQASAGAEALADLIQRHRPWYRLPQVLNRTAAIANKTLDVAENKVSQKTLKILSDASFDPKLADSLLEFLPASERNSFLKYLSQPQTQGPIGEAIRTGEATYFGHDPKERP
jgi:hypothetical protein